MINNNITIIIIIIIIIIITIMKLITTILITIQKVIMLVINNSNSQCKAICCRNGKRVFFNLFADRIYAIPATSCSRLLCAARCRSTLCNKTCCIIYNIILE